MPLPRASLGALGVMRAGALDCGFLNEKRVARVAAPSQWAKATFSNREGVKIPRSLHPSPPSPPLCPPRLLSPPPRKLNHANTIRHSGARDAGIVSAASWEKTVGYTVSAAGVGPSQLWTLNIRVPARSQYTKRQHYLPKTIYGWRHDNGGVTMKPQSAQLTPRGPMDRKCR